MGARRQGFRRRTDGAPYAAVLFGRELLLGWDILWFEVEPTVGVHRLAVLQRAKPAPVMEKR